MRGTSRIVQESDALKFDRLSRAGWSGRISLSQRHASRWFDYYGVNFCWLGLAV